jgi:hypothetical protein
MESIATDQPVSPEEALEIGLEQFQQSSHILISALLGQLDEDDKDLVALWSRNISDAPRPPGCTAWHL